MKHLLLSAIFCLLVVACVSAEEEEEDLAFAEYIEMERIEAEKDVGGDGGRFPWPFDSIKNTPPKKPTLPVYLKMSIKALNDCYSGRNVTSPSQETVAKYERGKAFDVEKTINGNELKVKFKLIEGCCQKHIAKGAKLEGRRLVLDYALFDTKKACECICEYHYEMNVDLKDKKIDAFILDGQEI